MRTRVDVEVNSFTYINNGINADSSRMVITNGWVVGCAAGWGDY
jgi:hypothetical protein